MVPRASLLLAALALGGCSLAPEMFAARDRNVALTIGPPVEDVVTGFDEALTCLRGKIPRGVIFAVGQVIDATGKENYSEGGAGKYVTQGAGEMVQSALFRAGVSVVNRRDSTITVNEANWGIRDIKRQMPVNFYVSGSINSLDFIPGGGVQATIAGIGPRYRQSRILIALDLTMTDAYTGRVVASVPVQKQIFTSETGAGVNTFFGTTLVQLDAGGMQREALHFALRQMLSLATFELLGQIMKQDVYGDCRARINESVGEIKTVGTADREALTRAFAEAARPLAVELPAVEQAAQVAPPQAAGRKPAAGPAPAPAPAKAAKSRGDLLGEQAVKAATLSIKAARDSEEAPDRRQAVEKAAESLQLADLALRALRDAAEMGFSGDDGEVAAVVVQQSLQAAQRAGTAAAVRPADLARKPEDEAEDKPIPEDPAPAAAPPPSPVPPAGGPKDDGRPVVGPP